MYLLIASIYIVVFIKLLYPSFIRYAGFPNLPWYTIPGVILVTFIFIYLKSAITNHRFAFFESKLKPYRYTLLILLSIIMLSSLLNYNNILLVTKSLLGYVLIYILLFLAILEMNMKEKEQFYIIRFIYLILIIQIPVTFFQYFILGGRDADSNSGTISAFNVGGTGILAILMSFLLAYIVSQIFVKGFSVKRVLIALSTLFPVIAGGARISLILFPITIIITVLSFYLIKENRRLTSFFKGIIISVVALSILMVIIFIIIPQTRYAKFLDFESISSMRNIEQYDQHSSYKGSRILGYYIIFNSIFKDDLNILLGMGNESITQSQAAGSGNIQLSFLENSPDSMIFLASNGILGLTLLISIISIAVPLIKNYLEYEKSEFMRVVAYSMIPVSFNVIAALFYTTAWTSQIGLLYWILLGLMFQRFIVLKRSAELLEKISKNYTGRLVINQI